ncbi:DUF5812 family protein [Salarchaeum japonicum]|uniref:DUF5812 family protein n=1 Tax=Salarchaeum japonicum TaxID=555573 RepID=UPI003C7253F6
MSEKSGTFLVTHADEDSAVLADVRDTHVHTLSSNPGVEAGEVLEATVSPDPPMEVTWSVTAVEDRTKIPVERSEERPTTQAYDLHDDLAEGDVTTTERAGTGEVHVLAVPPAQTEDAVADVEDDQATLERAARLGVNRVEIRFDADEGVVSVRYLP